MIAKTVSEQKETYITIVELQPSGDSKLTWTPVRGTTFGLFSNAAKTVMPVTSAQREHGRKKQRDFDEKVLDASSGDSGPLEEHATARLPTLECMRNLVLPPGLCVTATWLQLSLVVAIYA